MPVTAATRRTLTPVAIVTVAALIFTILLVLVRLQFSPLESVDHHAAAWLNSLVSGDATAVSVIKAVTWLGVTAFAVELSRKAAGEPVTDPVTEGLEPEAREDLRPAEPETPMRHDRAIAYGRIAAGVAVIWVLIAGALTGIGKLIMITHNGNGNLLGDHAIPHWLAAHRTPSLNGWSLTASNLGATRDILIVSVVTCVVFLAVTRRLRPVVFVAAVMFGELAAFLTIAYIVKRPRPDVPHLDSNLPTSAFPSGHMAATTCLYVAIAILVIGHARGWWRYLFLIPAAVMPVLFAALWLTATTVLIKPNKDALERSRRGPLGLPRRKDAARVSRDSAPANR